MRSFRTLREDNGSTIGGTVKKICYICGSDRFVDNHHYDCQEGKLSPETVPLCRRCHRTYHDWGIRAFSPDTTDKALEVENKRREILRSLPPSHPLQKLQFATREAQTPLKLEDVKRSTYWYKKWGIKPPRREKRVATARMPFRIASNPLCGDDWLRAHLIDHTPEEIGALTIEIGCNGNQLPPVSVADKKGTVKAILGQSPKPEVK